MLLRKNELIHRVLKANLLLPKYELVTFTWGNVSEVDRELGIIVVKASGVEYDVMNAEHMVITDLEGNVLEGVLNPSSDLPTHVELYRAFPEIKGVVHTHSTFATSFAQANMDLKCMGTTHADNFYGDVFCTRAMTKEEIETEYEKNTGLVIVEEFKKRKINSAQLPGVLVANHGPFIWGKNALDAVHNAKVLEEIAKMNYYALTLNDAAGPIQKVLLDKHYLRKHGENAYYGQKK